MDTKQVLAMQVAAQKLWGEEERVNPLTLPKAQQGGTFTGGAGSSGIFELVTKQGWKRHLANLVTSDNPELYLKENS